MKTKLIALAVSFSVIAGVRAATSYATLVAGVSQLFDNGGPGPVLPTDASWHYIVAGSPTASYPSRFIMARTYGAGRIVMLGHEGFFGDDSANRYDNTRFLANTLNWLDNGGSKTLFISQGHQEWLAYNNRSTWLRQVAVSNGFSVVSSGAPMNVNLLNSSSVLILGNAWSPFSQTEIDEVGTYVANGGGLVIAGLGWSWLSAATNHTMQNYPMQPMANQFAATWGPSDISDYSKGIGGTPIFTTFYPNVLPFQPYLYPFIASKAFTIEFYADAGFTYQFQSTT
ncbi:MAG TPA: hypothetical protein VHB20_19475, partial [Verrucomicrobiae bacterium]|nr:hypothetical protein [Verrucomicrobiae bacterium]